MADEQFCLRWDNHRSTLISVFDSLLGNETLVDCTLAADGQFLKAHRVILCACSPYLETLLSQHYEKHPILILKDVKLSELKSLMDYMYRGEVNISQDQLGSFLKVAELLQIKGLSVNETYVDAVYNGSSQPVTTTSRLESPRPIVATESSAHRCVETSKSPPSRKRKKVRDSIDYNNSTVEDANLDTSNSCDLPSQSQSIPMDTPLTNTTSANKNHTKPEPTNIVERINPSNLISLPFESGPLKVENEHIEPLLKLKNEYLEDVITEDIVEDLTLDDDEGGSETNNTYVANRSSMFRPGHCKNLSITSNQGFAPWQSGGNQSRTDEVFMGAQDAVNTQSDYQHLYSSANNFRCISCGKCYQYKQTLIRHQRYECGDKRPFACSFCAYTTKQNTALKLHMLKRHNQNENN